jgi:protein TonB
VVDEQGTTGQDKILAADPEGVIDQSVLRCVTGWRFKPGTVGGVAVKALVEQTITFKLE